MTNIYILSKSYLDFVFCSLFIGGQKEITLKCGCYVHMRKHTHTRTHTREKHALTLKTTRHEYSTQ